MLQVGALTTSGFNFNQLYDGTIISRNSSWWCLGESRENTKSKT